MPIQATNTWPANTRCVLAWRVKNTGDITGTFKARFWDRESDKSFELEPDREVWMYFGYMLPHVYTPSVGEQTYTFEILSNGRVVAEYDIRVITTGDGAPPIQPPKPKPIPIKWIAGITIVIIVGGLIAANKERQRP